MDNAAMNIHVHIFVLSYILDIYIGLEFLDYSVIYV